MCSAYGATQAMLEVSGTTQGMLREGLSDGIIRIKQLRGVVCLEIIACLLIANTGFSGQLDIWCLPRPSVQAWLQAFR